MAAISVGLLGTQDITQSGTDQVSFFGAGFRSGTRYGSLAKRLESHAKLAPLQLAASELFSCHSRKVKTRVTVV